MCKRPGPLDSIQTSFDYTDLLARIKLVTRPDGGQTSFLYTDTPGAMGIERTVVCRQT
jgi:hypothetical protein